MQFFLYSHSAIMRLFQHILFCVIPSTSYPIHAFSLYLLHDLYSFFFCTRGIHCQPHISCFCCYQTLPSPYTSCTSGTRTARGYRDVGVSVRSYLTFSRIFLNLNCFFSRDSQLSGNLLAFYPALLYPTPNSANSDGVIHRYFIRPEKLFVG